MTQTQAASNGKKAAPSITKIDDYVQTGIIAVYIVQKLGRPTLNEIQNTALTRLFCKLDGRTLGRALKGYSRAGRNTISILQDRLPAEDGGAVVDVYCMKDPQRWRSPPEMAVIGDLLPKLLADPVVQEIKAAFDKEEGGVSDKEKKAKRGNDIDDYRNYTALIYTLDPLLGSQIHCPYTDKMRGITTKSGEKPEFEGIFAMDELDGSRLITSDVLSGWFTTNACRYGGAAEARAQYIAFKPIRIPSRIKPIQLVLPVNNAKQGASAPKSYECIPPGQILKLEFSAPIKGLFSSEQYEKLLHLAGDRPRRGLSPARGKRYGRFRVIGFSDSGAMKTGNIDFILDGLPDHLTKKFGLESRGLPTELNEEHVKYMVDAAERLKKVEIKLGTKPTEADTDEDGDDE